MLQPKGTIRFFSAVALSGAVALTAAACSSGGSSGGSYGGSGSTGNTASAGTSTGSGAVVTTHSTSSLGEVYTDSSGNTVYFADQEAGGNVVCTATCLAFWHPLTVASPGSGGLPHGSGKFGTVKRPDNGQTQVTYDGKPVYTFAEDKAPGDTMGNGFKDSFAGHNFTWHAVRTTASGAMPSSTATASTSGSPGSSGSSGYGY